MKKVVRILLAILMVAALALGITACKSECQKGNHDFTGEENVVKSATCETDGIKTVKCVNCDQTTEVTITKLGHDYTGETWKPCADDETQHQRTCVRSGCGYIDKVPHSFVEGVCVCGKMEGTPSCDHANKYLASTTPATCTSAKVEHWACHDCSWTEDKTVGEPLGHDYADAEWKISGETHYQECQRDGCNGRNTHTADMSAWAVNGTEHERHCKIDGCTIAENHEENVSEVAWTISDAENHYKVCPACGLHGEVGAHNHDKITKVNDNQHSVSCSVCSKIFGNVDHDWKLDEEKSHDSTCSEEGSKVYVCACGAEKSETVTMKKHTLEWITTETSHEYKCSVCGHVSIATANHQWEWNNTLVNEHYTWCKTCHYIDEKTRGEHDYTESFTCKGCGRTPEDVVVATYYKGEYHRFDTLVAAVASITDDEEAVIYLGEDLEGAGIFIPSNRNINFRLQGNSYTVVSGAVGSKNYESQGFHIEKNSTITIQNGTITSKEKSGVSMLIQNYARLTLMNNLVLDGTHLVVAYDKAGNVLPNYTLSNNFDTTFINNTTIYAKNKNEVAFDVWYGLNEAYYDGVKVILGENNTIEGIIEYGSQIPVTDWSKLALVMQTDRNREIRFSSNVPSCKDANITYQGNTDKPDGTKVIDHQKQTTLSYKDGHHYYACSRCDAHLDEVACTRETVPGRAATCTTKGITDGVECSVCGYTIVEQKEIDPLGHDFGESYVSVSETQHAHQCSRCGGYDMENAVNHTYVANRCEACEHEITEAEIIELMKGLTKDGDVLVSADSTFALVGFYGGKISNYNYALNDDKGNKIINCFDYDFNPGTDLLEGDQIKVTGKIKNYKGIVEFDGFTYELVKRGSSEITIEYNAEQIESVQLLDKDGNVITATDGKFMVERQTDVTLIVSAKEGFVVDGVTLNGVEIEFKDGKYIFEVTTENALKVLSRNPNALPEHNDPAKSNSGKIDITINSIDGSDQWGTQSYKGTNDEKGIFTIDDIKFEYVQIAKATDANGGGLQIRYNSDNAKQTYFNNVTAFRGDITKVIITYNSNTNDAHTLDVIVSTNADMSNGKTYTLSETNAIANIIESGCKYIAFKPTKNTAYITSIVIEYSSETPCENSHNPNHTDANPATCTSDGNYEYWTCADCGKYFIKNEAGKFVEVAQADTVIKAGHTPIDTEWQCGKATINGQEVFAHWHACENCDEKLDLTACIGEVKADTAKSATCTEEGKEADKVCGDCGQTVEVGATISALGHDYEYMPNEDGIHHDAMCKRCEDMIENANCEAINDDFDKNETHHWKLCICGNHIGEVEHVYENGTCECGAKEGAEAATIIWSVYTGSLAGTEWENKDEINALINGLSATQFVGDTVTFTIDENYRVVTITNTDDEENTVELTASGKEYSFTATTINEIKIAVVRQYTVSVDSSSAEGVTITAMLNGSETVELPKTVDVDTEVKLIISLGSLADTKVISGVTYTVEGGTAQSLLDTDGTIKNFNVTDNISVCVTLADKPAVVEPIILNFVNDAIIKDWTTSYISHTISGTSLNTTDVTSVVLSNAAKQTGTITDRPTLCAKKANQYVTVTSIKDIKVVTFNLTQWGTKTFANISIEYSVDGTTWTASNVKITTPAAISYTLPNDVSAKYVRLVYISSSTSNTQMGLTSIELTF